MKGPKMTKLAWTFCAVAIVASMFCVVLAQQPTAPGKIPNAAEEQLKQQPQLLAVTSHALNGRYQATYLGNTGYYLILDTHTGHCWEKHAGTPRLQDIGIPGGAKP
jgi:hypothetical protein